MSNVIRVKRRLANGAPGAPSTLKNAEIAFNEADNKLYYGKGDDGAGNATSIITIAGAGWDATPDLTGYATRASSNTFTSSNTFSSTSTLNIAGAWQIDGLAVLTNAAELNVLDSVVAGSAVANRALVVDSNKSIDLGTGGFSAATVTTTGNGSIGGNLTVSGNLTINGTTTTINSTTLAVDDKNVVLGDVATPTDVTADGGGFTLKGATDKTFNWVASTSSWTSSEHLDLASGKALKIAGVATLNATTLGSGVTASSLTSVGVITSGTWRGTAVAVGYGGTGLTAAVTGLLKGNGTSYSAATVDVDYLAPGSVLDGGVF